MFEKKRKNRIARSISLGMLSFGALGSVALTSIAHKPLIEGLRHGGMSTVLRKLFTSFGSGWGGLRLNLAKKAVRRLPLESRSNPSLRAAAILGQRRYFHGSQSMFDTPDVAKSNPENMFGPGFYTTSNFDVAKGYAQTAIRENAVPNVRLERLAPKKTFVLHGRRPLRGQAYIDVAEGYRKRLIAEGLPKPKIEYLSEYFNHWLSKMPSESFYKNISSMFGGDSEFRDYLLKQGYDSISHVGGMSQGVTKHRVLIVLKHDIIRTKAIMKLGDGQAVASAGTSTVSKLIRGARVIKSSI